jgi:hypothetical protein
MSRGICATIAAPEKLSFPRYQGPLDHDDFGSNRSKIMNVIDSNILRSGMRAENRYTLFLIPL